jgi:hypothetical protein
MQTERQLRQIFFPSENVTVVVVVVPVVRVAILILPFILIIHLFESKNKFELN